MKLRHIKKAFEYFGYECPEYIESMSDLKMRLEGEIQTKHELLVAIENAKETLVVLDENIDVLKNVILQVKAEEFREENPHVKDVFIVN